MTEQHPPSNPYDPSYTGYGQPGAYQSPGPYPYQGTPPPPQKGGSGWKVLLIILVAIVVCCGGTVAAGYVAFRQVVDTAKQALDRYEPREIEPGGSVRIAEVTVEEGWQLKTGKERTRVTKLTVSRGVSDAFNESSSLTITFTLYQGSKELTRVRCSGSVPDESTLAVECTPSFDDARSFDRVTVAIL